MAGGRSRGQQAQSLAHRALDSEAGLASFDAFLLSREQPHWDHVCYHTKCMHLEIPKKKAKCPSNVEGKSVVRAGLRHDGVL